MKIFWVLLLVAHVFNISYFIDIYIDYRKVAFLFFATLNLINAINILIGLHLKKF